MDVTQIQVIIGLATAIVAIFTFFKGLKEYHLQGAQRRVDLFIQMRQRLKQNEDFRKIAELLENDDPRLLNISFKEKRDFLDSLKKLL